MTTVTRGWAIGADVPQAGPPGPGVLMSLLPPAPTGVSGAEARQPGKASRFSVNWVAGNADVEVLDATTGRRRCGGASRLCKHVLSTRWARLYGKVGDGGPEPGSAPGDEGTKPVPGLSPPPHCHQARAGPEAQGGR